MLGTLLHWSYVSILAFVYGFFFFRRFPRARQQEPQPTIAILVLIGLAGLASIAGWLSLVMPLGLAANLLILLTAIAIGIQQRQAITEFLQEKTRDLRQMRGLTILAFLTVCLVILVKSAQASQNYDTGLYHAQAIRWMETYRAIPGLGNLADRLVFPSSGLVLSALFSFAFLGLGSLHTLNGLLAVLVTGAALGKFDRLLNGEIRLSNAAAVFLPFLLRRIFSLELSSPGTDLPAALLVWIIVILALEKMDQQAVPALDAGFAALAVLSVFALTIKLSALPVLLLALVFWLRQERADQRRSLFFLAGVSLALLLPWMARSVVQSGYPVYPLAVDFGLHPDWQIPAETVRDTNHWIRSWAKVPTADREAIDRMPFRVWAAIWYQNQVPLDRQILLLAAAATGSLLFLFAYRTGKAGLRTVVGSPYAAVYLTIAAGIVFWFLQAPAMRFGYGFLGIYLAVSFAPWLVFVLARSARLLRWGAPLLLVLLILYQGVSIYRLADPQALRPIILLPAPYPQVATQAHTLGSLTLYTPVEGDQCWYEPFPCVPAIPSAVEMRGENLLEADIRDGFRVAP